MNRNKILIIKPSGIGDIVHSLAVAIGIKYIYPQCEIHWLVFDKFEDILNNHPYIDKIISWKYSDGIKEYFRLIRELRKENYDLIVDLQVLLRSSFLGYMIKYKRVLSNSFVRELSYPFVKPVAKFNKELHAVERNYQVVEYLAEKEKKVIPNPFEFLPWFKISKEQEKKAKELLNFNPSKKYILVSLGSRGYHKIWPTENFLKLINLLNRYFFQIVFVFVGTSIEQKLFRTIENNLTVEYENLICKISLRDLPSIINLCSFTISNDNGVAHISAALDKPTLILFGPSNPKWFYPYNRRSGYIYKSLPCSPCGIKTSCKNNRCMSEISVDEVFDFILNNFSKYLL